MYLIVHLLLWVVLQTLTNDHLSCNGLQDYKLQKKQNWCRNFLG